MLDIDVEGPLLVPYEYGVQPIHCVVGKQDSSSISTGVVVMFGEIGGYSVGLLVHLANAVQVGEGSDFGYTQDFSNFNCCLVEISLHSLVQ